MGFGFGFVNTVSGTVFCTPPDVVEPDAGVDSVTGEPEAESDDCFATAALTIRAAGLL